MRSLINPRVRHRALCLCAALALLGACVPLGLSGPSREQARLDAYVGGPASELVQDRGTPWKSRKRYDGGWVYLWRECRMEYDWHGRQWPRFCETRADVGPDGTVEKWRWHGNECPLRGVESGCDPSYWW